ncbi:MAG TPA: response regulator transcription factor [Bacteroidia bacterium]|nr:response regulator transcription factor [Bacteroidia bacterium]HNT80160.1 response regulator transcription factor [Bacteroidia bacterium]
MNVLIIEDEKSLSHEIEIFLTEQGYHCDVAFNGRVASERIFVNTYDFILLDLGLPDMNGLSLLGEAKKAGSEAAIIILTARGELEDKVKGLEMGADDYLAKPFALAELFARMQAITRRKHGLTNTVMKISEFEMDLNNRMVTHNGDAINLTKKEFDLMNYLALNKNRVLTRMQLSEHIWGDVLEEEFDSNFIDVHIKNLRKKLSAKGSIDWIETVRGIGYRANLD